MTEIVKNFNSTEKSILLRNDLLNNKTELNTIKNIGNYLSDSFSKIDGFQYEWNSLITCNPLLFEDLDYLKVRQFVKNTITDFEIISYKEGKISEIYATFENMLICNLQYYDRIMSFCTIAFLHYVRITDNEVTSQHLDKIPFLFELTPTQIWCAALSNASSSVDELNYGWSFENNDLNLKHLDLDKTPLEENWNSLYNVQLFAKFTEYASVRCGSTGFRQTLIADKTSNRKLAQVCTKFTKATTALSEESLNTIHTYVEEIENKNKKLYLALHSAMMKLFNSDNKQFAIYIYAKEFYIHTTKFSMKVSKDDVGRISKDYLANSYECFLAEEYLFKSIKAQIEWAKYTLPFKFDYEKEILKSLLLQMLNDNFKQIICIKRMHNGIVSKIKFSGIYNKLWVDEELLFDNRILKNSRICLAKENAAKYVIDRGYYIFGNENDIHEMSDTIDSKLLVEHYSKYCIPIMKHMNSVISLHTLSKNDIIDVVCSGILNPSKLNNRNIKYTDIKSHINPKHLMNSISNNQQIKKNYWEIIEDEN